MKIPKISKSCHHPSGKNHLPHPTPPLIQTTKKTTKARTTTTRATQVLNSHLFSIHRLDTKPWGILNSWEKLRKMTTRDPLGSPAFKRDTWVFPKYRGFPKSSHFNRVFHYKPSILGYHYFWKHLYIPNEYPCDTRCVWG